MDGRLNNTGLIVCWDGDHKTILRGMIIPPEIWELTNRGNGNNDQKTDWQYENSNNNQENDDVY
jgi:hypothetical protein